MSSGLTWRFLLWHFLRLVLTLCILSANFTNILPVKKRRGIATFALMHKRYPYKRAIKALVGINQPVIAVLYGTFGKDENGLEAFLNEYPNLTVIFHIANGSGRRKRDRNTGRPLLFRGELWKRLHVDRLNFLLGKRKWRVIRPYRKRIKKILALIDKYGDDGHKFILSIGLEDNYTAKAVGVLLDVAREEWPHKISRNPVRINETNLHFGHSKLDFVELHSSRPILRSQNSIWSNDGASISFTEQRSFNNRISSTEMSTTLRGIRNDHGIVYLWDAESQGLLGSGSGDRKTPIPYRRTFDFTTRMISGYNRLLKNSQ